MVGYIISINRCKEEDLIVKVLTQSNIHTLYRFYGARHSTINLGYKIDCSIEEQTLYINRLRNILHISYSWLFDHKKLLFWQQFIKLLDAHLRDVDSVESIYFEILERAAKRIEKQNPKRVFIEEYIHLLENEGRLHSDFRCLGCEEIIQSELSLTRSFHPAHKACIYESNSFSVETIRDLFLNKSTIFLTDSECDVLYAILLEGL